MSLLVVDRAEQLEKIARFREVVRDASVSEESNKKEYEKKVNKFLDFILEQKSFFRQQADEIGATLPQVEEFSWFSELDEEGLAIMGDIISLMNKLHVIMRTRYIKANVFFTRKNIGTQELKQYKAVANDLRELAADLHIRFFVFPKDDEFQAITNELNGL